MRKVVEGVLVRILNVERLTDKGKIGRRVTHFEVNGL